MAEQLRHNNENISVVLSQFSLSSVSTELFLTPSNPTFFYLITKFSFRIREKDAACISNVLSPYSDLDEVGGEGKNPRQNNKKRVHQVGSIPCYCSMGKVCLRKSTPHGSNICYFFLVKAHPEHAKLQLQHILKYLDASIRTVYVWEMRI